MNELLQKQGKKLDAQLDINMPWNHPTGKENLPGLNTEERKAQLEADMLSQLDEFSRFVAARDAYRPDSQTDYELSSGMNLFDLLISKTLNFKSH